VQGIVLGDIAEPSDLPLINRLKVGLNIPLCISFSTDLTSQGLFFSAFDPTLFVFDYVVALCSAMLLNVNLAWKFRLRLEGRHKHYQLSITN
jgi:hypothetical protein